MALTVEDGTGLSDADSYVSVADCDAYHTARGNTGWTELPASPSPTTQKEQWLRKATAYIDDTYFGKWKGYRLKSSQALSWPREGVCIDGVDYDYIDAPDNMPKALLNATCEVALLLATGVDLSPALEHGGRVKALTQVVGPISQRVAYADDASSQTTYTAVERMIRPLLYNYSKIMSTVVRG